MARILQSTTKPELKFEILEYDKNTKIAKLRGQYSTEFFHELTVDVMKKYHYTIVEGEPVGVRNDP